MSYTDEDGRVWYSRRTKVHSDQTKKRAAENAADKAAREADAERRRLVESGADPAWIERVLPRSVVEMASDADGFAGQPDG